MMKKYLAIFGWMVPVFAYAATVPLPIPKYGEASLQSRRTVEFDDTDSVFITGTNVNSFTYCGWFRCEPIENVAMPMAALACGAISVEAARSTIEGGSKLENIMPFDMDTNVPLDSGGEWSAVVLPANPDVPSSMTYGGAYCINVICDKACVVTVGGVQIDVPVSKEVFIRNVWPDTPDDRTVSVSTDAGAAVKLGVALNPIVKFYPIQTDSVFSDGDWNAVGGIVTNEYRFLVWRAKLDGKNLAFEVGGWVRAGKMDCWRTNVFECSAKTFAKDARFKLDFGASSDGAWAKLKMREFGIKAFGEWIDDDMLLQMRDKDWDAMVRRGVTYDSERGAAWTIEAAVETIPSSAGEIVTKTDANSTVEYTVQNEVRNSSRKMVLHARSYLLDGFGVSDDDMEWSCETAGASYTQSSNVFEFAAGGTYRMKGYNRKLGEAREIDVNLSDGQAYVNYTIKNPTDKTKPYAHALAAVVEAMGAAEISPRKYYVNGNVQTANCVSVKHIPSVPIYSSAGAQGNRGVVALSKHTWISAAHWCGFEKSQLKFTDGGAVTNSVWTDGSWTKLSTWAKANGFSDAACAAVGDVAVGKFADGAVDDAFVPYLMDAETMSNAFGNVSIPAFRATQVEQGGAVPVVVRGGRGCEWISGQSVDAEAWANAYSFIAADVDGWKALPAADLVDAVAAMAARKAVDAPLFPECFGGDSGLPTYAEVEDGVFVLLTQNHTICGGDSDVVAADILKAWILTNGDEVKEFVYSAKPTARDYIQDGLVAMWDGIENAGWGKHDSTTTTWTDLANGGRDATITGGAWGENYFEYGNKDITFSGTLFDGDFTIEFIISGDATNCQYYATPLTCDSDDFSFFRRDGLYWEVKLPGDDGIRTRLQPFAIKPWYATRSYTNGIDAAYYDGSGSMRYKDTSKTDKGYTGIWYIGGNGGRMLGKGAKIYCVRIYNRVLTAEEIKHNYEIDCKRFGTAADE